MEILNLSNLKAALDLYQTQYGATDKLWAYFSTASFALLGFSVGSDRLSKSIVEPVIIVVAYLIFCVGNFIALFSAQKQLVEFSDIARKVAQKSDLELFSLYPIDPLKIAIFYWCVVFAICLSVLLVSHRRIKKEAARKIDTDS